ncbi:TRAPP subunit [Lignoscripta atroalba]|nr:TRAPP subunit [Lignoscripta atroalba]
MSYYFCIVGTKDNPLFELEFGTSKAGGDGVARFPAEARHLNQFIVHSSLDIVEEVQWLSSQMYLKRIDHFASSHISCFLTPTSTKFLLLHLPHPPNTAPSTLSASQNPHIFPPFAPYTTTNPPSSSILRSSTSSLSSSSSGGAAAIPNNPTAPATEEAMRMFFNEVFEAWIKAVMNPFQGVNKTLGSPVFRGRVMAAGRKYL